jgi:hypothetical protein
MDGAAESPELRGVEITSSEMGHSLDSPITGPSRNIRLLTPSDRETVGEAHQELALGITKVFASILCSSQTSFTSCIAFRRSQREAPKPRNTTSR